MRIKKLKVANFRNLQDFSIDFDEESFTTVIVGQNGTGKSNLLEALIIIFRDLDLAAPPAFKYELHYTCREQEIYLDADPDRVVNEITIKVDDDEITYAQFSSQRRERYLPKYVFGYYSGFSNRMERHFEKHQERFNQTLHKRVENPLRPLLYARHVHSQLALLAFFYEQDDKILDFLNKQLRIEGLDSILFVIKQPPNKSQEGAVWNLSSARQNLLSKLYQFALAPMYRKEPLTSLESTTQQTREQLYLYLPDLQALRQLAKDYVSPRSFFKVLDSAFESQLISDVLISVQVKDTDGSLTFHELSEGEQQLLMVLGLLRFTKEDESLFLLDEPDTHLNPAWSMQYLDFLNEIVGEQQTSHIIMATHDPLVVAGVEQEQVRILRFEKGTCRILAEQPEYSPIKMGYAEILTSDLFGLRAVINPTMLRLMDEKRELAIKDQLTSQEKDRLARLNEELSDFDFTTTVRDPHYEPFVRAMAEMERAEKLQTLVLTKEQREKRKQLAAELLRKIKA